MASSPSSRPTGSTTLAGRLGFQVGLAAAVAVPVAAGALWMVSQSGGEVEATEQPAALALEAAEPIRHVVDLGELGSVVVMDDNGVLVLGEVMVADGWEVAGIESSDGELRVTLADGEEAIVAKITTGDGADAPVEVKVEPTDIPESAKSDTDETVEIADADDIEDSDTKDSDEAESDKDDADEKDESDKDDADEEKHEKDDVDTDTDDIQTRADIDAEVAQVVVERDGKKLYYSVTSLDAGFEHHTWANGADYVKGWVTNGTDKYWFKAWIEGDEIVTRSWHESLVHDDKTEDDKKHDDETDEPDVEVQVRAEIDAEVGTVVIERDGDVLSYAVSSKMEGYDHVVVQAESTEWVKGYFTNGVDEYWFKAWADGSQIVTRAWFEQGEPEVEVQTRAEFNAEVGTVVVERDGDMLGYGVSGLMDGFDHVVVYGSGDMIKGYLTNGIDQYWFKAWIDGPHIKTNVWHEQVVPEEPEGDGEAAEA